MTQPVLGLLEARHGGGDELPEAGPVVHLAQMRHLVGGDIVEHVGGRQDQPPGERQQPARRARAPAGRLVAQRDVPGAHVELAGVPGDARVEILVRLRDQPVLQPARGVLGAAGDVEARHAARRVIDAHHAGALRGPQEADAMQAAAQRDGRAVGERHRLGHAAQPLANPVDMGLEEPAGFLDAASRGNRHHHRPACLAHSQRQSPRSRVLPHLDRHSDALDLERDGPRPLLAVRLHCVESLFTKMSRAECDHAYAPHAARGCPQCWPSK